MSILHYLFWLGCGISCIMIRTLSGASTQLVYLVCGVAVTVWVETWLVEGGRATKGVKSPWDSKKFMMVYEKK